VVDTDRDSYAVERSIDIDAPAARIYPRLVDFHEWKAWSPWEDLDPNLARSYSGETAGVGAIYEWSGTRKAGQGRMEICSTSAPDALSIQLDFLKPFKSSSTASFALTSTDTGTRVTWSMVGRKTLMTKFMGVFMGMDKMIGPDFEKGLARLKTLAES
jgi:hypothetical protein